MFVISEWWSIKKWAKGGFKSEDAGGFLPLQNKYSKSLSWAEKLNKLFTDLDGKFEFSAQNSNLECLFWRCKNPPVSSDLKPPLKHIGICFSYVNKQKWFEICHQTK